MTNRIRILIADDHLIIREGLRMILETGDDFELVGEAANGVEVVQMVSETLPDVVLLDLRMPEMSGLEALERIQRENPQVAVVILTTFNEDDWMIQGIRLGAKGYLLKDTDRQTLFNSIRAAARGETLLAPDVMAKLVSHLDREVVEGQGLLTDRELQILTAVSRGERSKEIAYHLGITERTVKAHLTNIYQKLGVDSRAAAITIASQKGLLN
jgi:two-component system, NarL family, response regulator YdfI